MVRMPAARWGLPGLAALLPFLLLVLAGLPDPPGGQESQALLGQARAALDQGQLAAAEALAARLLAGGPSSAGLVLLGELRLRRIDPAGAERAFGQALRLEPGNGQARLGLGRACLELLRPAESLALARELLVQAPGEADAWALEIRSLLDLGRAEEAFERAEASRVCFRAGSPELDTARGAALFRAGRIAESARAYQAAAAADALLPEPHLRLGSGLIPRPAPPDAVPIPGLQALEAGDLGSAIPLLRMALARTEADPHLHRMLGEALSAQRHRDSFLGNHPAAVRLKALLPDPGPGGLPLDRLFPAYAGLSASRRTQVHRAAALWAAHVPGLVRAGARHDFLARTESATDARERARLQGRRTADGRYWDHVRGLGGLHAATGVEALDQAAELGFNTLAHELTHQVHLFVLGEGARAQAEALFRAARAQGRCLDYYAATCVEEYLAQGAEAFVSLAKRPDGRRTFGHTRFELRARDPALEEFLARHGSWDPLQCPRRAELLEAAAEYALLAGRPGEARNALASIGEALSAYAADLMEQALFELRAPARP